MASKLKLSGAAVVLIVVVPLFMYAGALLIGIQLGRALERSPDSDTVSFSIRGAFAYLAKELWCASNFLGRQRGMDGSGRAARVWVPVPASLVVVGDDDESSSANKQSSSEREHRSYIPLPRVQGRRENFTNNHTSPRGVISVGPWGGSGGQPFYMRGGSPPPRLIRSITLYHSTAIHSLACDYGDDGANPLLRTAGPWGLPHSFGSRGVRATIKLSAGEHITAVAGTIGRFGSVPDAVITSLTFRTSTGRTYGPYGSRTTTTAATFSVPAADGACIVGFWGRSGWLVDAIGVYIKPSCSASSSNPAAGYNYSYRHQPYATRQLTNMEKRKTQEA